MRELLVCASKWETCHDKLKFMSLNCLGFVAIRQATCTSVRLSTDVMKASKGRDVARFQCELEEQ